MILTRMGRAFRRHGVLKSCRLIVYNVVYYLRRLHKRGESDTSGRALDELLGVETAKIREVGSLDIDLGNLEQAKRYQPSDVNLVRQSLKECSIDYSRYAFIDYGSGKGRVLFLASEFPFRRILGVEFSRELHEIAQKNIAVARGQLKGCHELEAVLDDAASFVPPDGPLVCYFYNPFGDLVMRDVVRNLEQSITRTSHPVFVIYVEPVHEHIFSNNPNWTMINRGSEYVIYRNIRDDSAPPSAAVAQ